MQRELFRLVNGIHRSVMRMSKENNFYPCLLYTSDAADEV